MAEKMNVPEIRFKGFSEEWEAKEFLSMASRISVISKNSELPRVEYEDIISGIGELNKNIYQKESSKIGIEFAEGDVLFGKLRPYLKNWLLASFRGIAVGDFWVLRGNETNSKFIYFLIQTHTYETTANQSSGTKMPRSDWNLVSKTEFSKPVLIHEQSRIGTYFQNLDKLITLHQRKHDKLITLKKAMLEKMFPKNGADVPEIRFKGFEGKWEKRTLGEIVSIKSGWSPSSFCNGGVLFIKVDDLNYSNRVQNDSQMKVIENSKFSLVSEGSIIFPKRGAAIMTNKVRILGKGGYMDTNMMALEPININSNFLYLFISRTGLYKIADTSTIPQINNKHIEPYCIQIPNPQEQTQIGTYFQKLDNLISLHQKELEKLKNIKKACLEKMFV